MTISAAAVVVLLLLAAAPTTTHAASPGPTTASDPSSDEAALLAAMLDRLTSLPALLWPDAPVAASLAAFVPAAREQLRGQATDGLRPLLHLRFLEARCNGDGGVALVFEEIGRPLSVDTYAYAVRGSMPTSPDDSWGGGTGLRSVLDDPELIHLMGEDTFDCP